MSGAISSFVDDGSVIPSGTTKAYKGQFVDENGVAVPNTSLSACTLSINDSNTGAVMNSVSAANILNDGQRGSIDGSGNLVLTLLPADTVMSVTAPFQEIALTIKWTYTGGKKGAKIVNLKLITPPGS